MKKFLPHLLIAVGVVLMCWPLGQRAFGWMAQRELHRQWAADAAKATLPVSASADHSLQTTDSPAWQKTRIIIPDLHIDAVVVNGFDEDALRRGPAHDPRSAMPGQQGNCVIAAHRNVYGAWFARVDDLFAGSLVQLKTPTATYDYHTVSIMRVSETDRSVLAPPSDGTARLTLITCTLPHSSDRMIVSAVRGDGL